MSGVGVLLTAFGYYIFKVILIVFGIPTYLVGFDPHLFAELAVSFILLVADSVVTFPITVVFTPITFVVITVLTGIVYLAAAARASGFAIKRLKYAVPFLDGAVIICFFITYVYSINALIALTDKSAMPLAGLALGENIIELNAITAGLSLMSVGYLILAVECSLATYWKAFNRTAATLFALLLVVNFLQVPQFFGVYSAYYTPLPVVETAGREYLLLIRSRDRVFLYDRDREETVVRKVGYDYNYVIKGYKRRAERVSPVE